MNEVVSGLHKALREQDERADEEEGERLEAQLDVKSYIEEHIFELYDLGVICVDKSRMEELMK